MVLLRSQPPPDLRPRAASPAARLCPDAVFRQRLRAQADTASLAWLLHDGSLTDRIARRFGRATVHALREGIGRPDALEAAVLQHRIRGGWWLREIELHAGGLARLHARTLVPADAPRLRTRLMGLGRTPLGRLLFRGDRLRTDIRRAARGFFLTPAGDWARMTSYRVGDEPMLVIERPLPALLEG